jgi:hypothetical protein
MCNYNTNFVITYQLIKEDNELPDDLYRSQFLQAFNLDKWDDNKIDEYTKNIYEKYNLENKFREIFDVIKKEKTIFSQYMLFYSEDSSLFDYFRLLFCYETFYLLHKFICELENKKIDNIKLKKDIIKNIKI